MIDKGCQVYIIVAHVVRKVWIIFDEMKDSMELQAIELHYQYQMPEL